ncbi:MAG: RluA family pseudouridine synthase [Alloprevotella sp.]|nr:RluA family pseudouridine synthase [Alloprevotella sp.]MBR1652279.1 RluA family pseudouridine synthase [Alloprevotella sp.]
MKQEYIRFTVHEPQELLPFLMNAMQGISRSRAKAILSGGGVRVNRAIVKQFDAPLKPRDVVEVSKQKPKATFQNRYVRIVYEDSQIIVIEKAAGILSMANVPGAFCVKSVLDDYFRKSHQNCRAHVVHRLDRETSGLLVYAKTIKAEQILEHNWQEIVTDRRYIALVSGTMEQKKGTVRSWLKENSAYVTYSSPVEGDGKLAVTHFETLEANAVRSLVRLKLETGRKNQIRVHMADLGHPVCGDMKYGNGDDPIHRLALHAFRLHFYHPITGEHLKFETPVPKSFLEGKRAKD